MNQDYKIIWPLILPYELPEKQKRTELFIQYQNNEEKVNKKHSNILKILRYGLPNFTGFILSGLSLWLLSILEKAEINKLEIQSNKEKLIKNNDFLSYYNQNESRTIWKRLLQGGDKRVNLCFASFYIMGYIYGNTIYYLNLDKMAMMYNFQY